MEKRDQQQLNFMLKKYREGKATAEEAAFLEKFYAVFEENESYFIDKDVESTNNLKNELKRRIDEEIGGFQVKLPVPIIKQRPWFRYLAAACVLVLVSLSTYFAVYQKPYQQVSGTNDFVPGTTKAMLTLADGRKILLDTVNMGTTVQTDGLTITKNAAGEIEYKIVPSTTNEVGYHTIATPNGGKYMVALPDGSKIWLNAASSLTYPTVFKGKERHVEMTGEAYFEVAKNKAMPFTVGFGTQKVEVLGTHFNINSYNDEQLIKTTLLEGSVKVSSAKNSVIIEPGQQAYASQSNNMLQKKAADLDQEIAWKNSLFSFKGDDLRSVMRQVSRWYDVEVIYDGPVTDEKFFGEISRTSKLSEVFAILELNNVHFKSRGRQIMVSSGNN